jgi:hypothetical protein
MGFQNWIDREMFVEQRCMHLLLIFISAILVVVSERERGERGFGLERSGEGWAWRGRERSGKKKN